MQVCKGCGAKSQDWENVCPYCGSALPNAPKHAAAADDNTAVGIGGSSETGSRRTSRTRWTAPHAEPRRYSWRPPPPPAPSPSQQVPLNLFRPRKNRILAALLAFFFGTFGLQWFYLGRYGRGLLCCVFSWSSIPLLLGIYDGIKFFTMYEEDFRQSYG